MIFWARVSSVSVAAMVTVCGKALKLDLTRNCSPICSDELVIRFCDGRNEMVPVGNPSASSDEAPVGSTAMESGAAWWSVPLKVLDQVTAPVVGSIRAA